MTYISKLLARVLSGQSDTDIDFAELTGLLERLGFRHRSKGSHHIFTRADVYDRINLQADGSKAKRYQVKQVREILTKYGIGEQSGERDSL